MQARQAMQANAPVLRESLADSTDRRDFDTGTALQRRFVDELNARATTALEGCVEIVDGKANVMNPRSPLGKKARDRGFFVFRLEQLHQSLCRARTVARELKRARPFLARGGQVLPATDDAQAFHFGRLGTMISASPSSTILPFTSQTVVIAMSHHTTLQERTGR